jgi:nucleotide-binding universal stress UspA family protein
MTTLKRILACTDFSAAARRAAERAALLSKATGARLELLHVANLSPLQRLHKMVGQGGDQLERIVVESGRKRLGELAETLSKRYGVAAAGRVFTGPVISAISREADADSPGLIVCGATGESTVRRVLIGSTAERLLSKAGCPVLVVKQMPRDDYRRLLVAVDFSSSSLRAIAHARTIAPRADVVVLHAFEVPFEGQMRYASVTDAAIDHYRQIEQQQAQQALAELSRDAGLGQDVPLRAVHGHPVLRIVEQEQEQDCDLIVVGKRGQSLVEELLLGSVSKRVVAESQSDVLVSI